MRKYFSIFLFFSLFSCESYFFDKYNIVQPKIYNYEDNIYTVKKGDNLYSISKSFNLPIQKIIKSNKIKFPFKIYPNQKIFLPKNKNYIVKKGDTLYSISRKFKTDVFALANFNKLNKFNYNCYLRELLQNNETYCEQTQLLQKLHFIMLTTNAIIYLYNVTM